MKIEWVVLTPIGMVGQTMMAYGIKATFFRMTLVNGQILMEMVLETI